MVSICIDYELLRIDDISGTARDRYGTSCDRRSRESRWFILFGIVPLFLFFSLIAHALAKALFLRRSAPGGLQGSVAAQERAILTMMGIIGLIILLLALGIESFASPAFLQDAQRGLEPLGRFYDWLVSIIAYGI